MGEDEIAWILSVSAEPADERRNALLGRILAQGSLLSGALDLLAASVSTSLRVPVAVVSLVERDRQSLLGRTGIPADAGRETPISHSFCQYVVQDTAAVVIDSARDDPRVAENPAIVEDRVAAYAGQPIVVHGHVVGSLCAIDHVPHAWTEHEVRSLRSFADLAEYLITARLVTAGAMLDHRASAQARDQQQLAALDDFAEQKSEHDQIEALSRRLQHALLPKSTPPGHLALDAFYEPGSQRLLLGGDFADTMRDPDDNLNFVVGDVTGHGPEAAALAISLRAGWNALQGVGVPLAQIAAELDKQTSGSGLFATVIFGRVEHDGCLCLLGAGHPPPILVDAAGARELDIAPGPMLGLGLQHPSWQLSQCELGDDELILYTDGLIEGRVDGGPEHFGVERLIEAIGVHGTDPETLCRVATDANGAPLPDDVAILRIRTRR